MAPLHLVLVAGTRPEALKLAPLVLAARAHVGCRCTLVATGQHGALFDEALAVFGLAADHRLGPSDAGLTIEALQQRITAGLPPLLDALAPDWLVVQGDTTSAWWSAITARRLRVPVAHVEAGLRSGDPMLPWPEERNRIEIDHAADLLFAPSKAAAENLRTEGVGGTIHVTGNSGIDALMIVRDQLAPALPIAAHERVHRLFVTCHRRDAGPEALDSICAALRTLAKRWDVAITVALPGDPVKAARLGERLGGIAAIALVPPLGYREAVAALIGSSLVLSDSGGLQEECPALGVPLLVLRPNSERPEVVAAGNALVVGTGTETIVAAATRLLDDPTARGEMCRLSFPYGAGDAATRMLAHLLQHPRPRA